MAFVITSGKLASADLLNTANTLIDVQDSRRLLSGPSLVLLQQQTSDAHSTPQAPQATGSVRKMGLGTQWTQEKLTTTSTCFVLPTEY
jgi:hypothetical protein